MLSAHFQFPIIRLKITYNWRRDCRVRVPGLGMWNLNSRAAIEMDLKEQSIREASLHKESRALLLSATRKFVLAARCCIGIRRIALIGSLTTTKVKPKDTDLLLTIEHAMDLGTIARIGRQLQGGLQRHNLGADIFLANALGNYIGRICSYRECRPRMACRAGHCGRYPHLNDDLRLVTLSDELIATPPIVLWPRLVRNCSVPADVDKHLIEKIDEAAESTE